jgi:hypothetical protein
MTNSNDLAFARPAFYHPEGGVSHPQDGCTKREYFAAMAMQGIISNSKNHLIRFDDAANQSVIMADALINALNKEK